MDIKEVLIGVDRWSLKWRLVFDPKKCRDIYFRGPRLRTSKLGLGPGLLTRVPKLDI